MFLSSAFVCFFLCFALLCFPLLESGHCSSQSYLFPLRCFGFVLCSALLCSFPLLSCALLLSSALLRSVLFFALFCSFGLLCVGPFPDSALICPFPVSCCSFAKQGNVYTPRPCQSTDVYVLHQAKSSGFGQMSDRQCCISERGIESNKCSERFVSA